MVSSGLERATLSEMLVDDGNLIERLRTGDDTAFEELVDHHAAPLLAVTRRILRDEEEARDAVQETFVAASTSTSWFALPAAPIWPRTKRRSISPEAPPSAKKISPTTRRRS
jgi:hypothetical protein